MSLVEFTEFLVNATPIVVTAASSVAALTPTPKENSFLAKLYKVIDVLAINIGKAKEKGK